MAQVTGSIGNQPVELNNAATESTLAQLLAIMQRVAPQQARALQQIASSSGISPAAIRSAEDALRELGDAADRAASSASSSFSRLPNMITPIFADLTSGLINTTKNLGTFAQTALNGTNTVAGLLRVFEQLPFGLGAIASIFRTIAEFNQPILETFRSLADVGLNTSNVFDNLRSSASSMGLGLSELDGLLRNNSETLAMMGRSAGQGADSFMELAKDIKKSGIGGQLLQLGFGFTSFNQGILDFISMTGARTADQMADRDSLKKSTSEYLFQLDKLSQLTGKSREEQAKQLKEAAMNEAIRAKLMSMGDAERTKFAIGLQNALAVGGKGAMDAFKSEILGIAPVTEEAKRFTSLNAEAATANRQAARDAMDTTKTIGDINKSGAEAMKSTVDRVQAIGSTTVGALSMLQTGSSETVMTMQRLTNLLKSKGLTDIKSIEEFLNSREQPNRAMIDTLLKQEQTMLDARAKLQVAMEELSKGLTPVLTKGLIAFAEAMGEVDWEKLGKEIGEFGSNLFSEEGRQKIVDSIVEGFANIFFEVTRKIKDSLTPDWFTFLTTPVEELRARNSGKIASMIGPYADFAPGDRPNNRYLGSLGATGRLFENFGSGTPMMLHGTESVVTPEQMNTVINSAVNQNNSQIIETMRLLQVQNNSIINALNNIADNTRRTYGATRNLDTNLFAR